ncbi:hypothetical protein FGO68_gene1037 [Halteria grandinella]|uniref:Uncharacterized protein n=1 Tax=Halteria grandinella TaxID=5974 RepID=A0A8J8NTC1_HALGN|nr:hypothetical protein FGO68_gene1037 [Halteria grandinella]
MGTLNSPRKGAKIQLGTSYTQSPRKDGAQQSRLDAISTVDQSLQETKQLKAKTSRRREAIKTIMSNKKHKGSTFRVKEPQISLQHYGASPKSRNFTKTQYNTELKVKPETKDDYSPRNTIHTFRNEQINNQYFEKRSQSTLEKKQLMYATQYNAANIIEGERQQSYSSGRFQSTKLQGNSEKGDYCSQQNLPNIKGSLPQKEFIAQRKKKIIQQQLDKHSSSIMTFLKQFEITHSRKDQTNGSEIGIEKDLEIQSNQQSHLKSKFNPNSTVLSRQTLTGMQKDEPINVFRDRRTYGELKQNLIPLIKSYKTLKTTERHQAILKPLLYQTIGTNDEEIQPIKIVESTCRNHNPYEKTRVRSQLSHYKTMNDYQAAEDQRVKLDQPAPPIFRSRTKDRFFGVRVKTNMEQYETDQHWLGLANPKYLQAQKEKDAWDKEVLERMLKMNRQRSDKRLKVMTEVAVESQ